MILSLLVKLTQFKKHSLSNCTIDLDLSNKGLSGEAVSNITRALLNHNIGFTFLNLSGNAINTAKDFENIFPTLSGVVTLDLSKNGIGFTDSKGTIALAEGLSYLSHLTSLDLSNNLIGFTDSKGTIALAEGLPYLSHLTSLDLSDNLIDIIDSKGAMALAEGLSHLPNLTFLNFSRSHIGWTDSKGTVALGEGFTHLSNLTSLDLSHSAIGYKDSLGTIALAEGLSYLSHLTFLDFSGNAIGYTDSNGIKALVSSLPSLRQLKIFQILPNFVTNANIVDLNKALNYTQVSLPLQTVIVSPDDVNNYCPTLLSSGRSCDLSRRMPSPNAVTMAALMQCLKSKKSLNSLDLSYNLIGFTNSSGVGALAEGLSHLTNLTSLDLSINYIGFTDSDGTVALGESLSQLPHLTSFKLFHNLIEFMDSSGVEALAEGLYHLTNLTSLDLSYGYIGYKDSNGTVALGKSLSYLSNITSLNLYGNYIGFTDSDGTVALGKGLSQLPNLTFLDLSINYIGFTDSNGTTALAKGLNQTQNLQILNLGFNRIGLTGPDGPEALISVLLSKNFFSNLSSENLGLQGMTNVSWTSASQSLQNLQSQAMMDECQVSRCFGEGIVSSSFNQKAEVSSFPGFQSYTTTNTTSLELSSTTVLRESRALVVYDEATAGSVEPDTLSTLGASALSGIVFAALPEALGDALHLSGVVSERNAYHVKMAANAGLVFATGSWLPVGASWLTSTGLKYLGCSESKARVGGNAVGFLMNTGKALTPTGIAAVAVNYAAGRLGLWAEKSMIKRFFLKTQTATLSPVSS